MIVFLFNEVRSNPDAVIVTFGLVFAIIGLILHFFDNKVECTNLKTKLFSIETCSFSILLILVGFILLVISPLVKKKTQVQN